MQQDLSPENLDHSLDYYSVLRVPRTAPPKFIREAFLRLKSIYDPQNQALYSLVPPVEQNKMLKRIELAYAVLNNPQRRSQYDRAMRGEAPLPPNSAKENRRLESQAHAANSEDHTKKLRFKKLLGEHPQVNGPILQGLRKIAAVSLDEIQDTTKISKQHLLSMETDNFAMLPSEVYLKGYLNSYLRQLGFTEDYSPLAESYLESYRAWRLKNRI